MCSEGLVAHETTVLVAVSSPRVREALVAVISAMEGFRVVGEATTAEQAVQLARAERPMLALVDDDLADCSGTWTMQELSGEVVVVAIGWRANAALQARAAGARMYIEMGGSPEDVLSALLDVCPKRAASLPRH
jgi:DNA-binding NarL/FixJ family response regulator